jgi:hypothetical protein
MSIALEHLCLTVPFAMPDVQELSVWIGVGCWVCPMSVRVVHSQAAYLPLWNKAPSSALAAKGSTAFKMEHGTWTLPLIGGGGAFGSMKEEITPCLAA